MAACHITGHPDTYGLGIRIAFYIQWFGMIFASWLPESDALNLKFLNGLTIAATSVGLALDLGTLQPAEIYVVLLLVCGTLYFLVPVYLWRLITCCHPWWDTERWSRMRMGWLFKSGMGLMLGALLGLQIWFWCTGVYERPTGTDTSCQQYGFLFGQVQLDSPAITAVNIILSLAILLVGTWKFSEWIGVFEECRWYRRRKRRRWSITTDRIESLQQLRTISDVIVAAIVTTAVELAISWNTISDVNDLSTGAQLVPSFISAAYLLRSIYVWIFEPSFEENHLVEFPYFPRGSGGSGIYTTASDSGGGGGGGYPRRNMVYLGSSRDWEGQRRQSNPHNRRRHRGQRSSQMDPAMIYAAHGAMGYPDLPMSEVPYAPASAAIPSRHAPVVNTPDERYAADDGPAPPAPDAAAPQVPPATASIPGNG